MITTRVDPPRAGAPSFGREPPSAPTGWLDLLLTGLATTAAAAHVPAIPPHLHEAPYMGVLFVLLTASMVICAYGILTGVRQLWRAAAVGLAGAAVIGYCLTRVIALPLLSDDVGNWFEPLGVVSVVTELGIIAAGATGFVHQSGARRPTPSD
jgi:hypothetical protein